jgi:hypothetical protein
MFDKTMIAVEVKLMNARIAHISLTVTKRQDLQKIWTGYKICVSIPIPKVC